MNKVTIKVKGQPLGDRVLFQATQVGEKTQGGILIPEQFREKTTTGTVVALGTGALDEKGKRVPFEVKVGDTVLVSKYGGTEVQVDGQDYKVLDSKEVLMVFR